MLRATGWMLRGLVLGAGGCMHFPKMDAMGYGVDAKGYRVGVKGCRVDAKGYSVGRRRLHALSKAGC
eukprot:1195805-Prorocentrum_minimum.AAC.3